MNVWSQQSMSTGKNNGKLCEDHMVEPRNASSKFSVSYISIEDRKVLTQVVRSSTSNSSEDLYFPITITS